MLEEFYRTFLEKEFKERPFSRSKFTPAQQLLAIGQVVAEMLMKLHSQSPASTFEASTASELQRIPARAGRVKVSQLGISNCTAEDPALIRSLKIPSVWLRLPDS